MQTLTLEGVKAAARAYYDSGKLLALYPDYNQLPGSSYCRYQGPEGYRCAVGAALSEESISYVTNGGYTSMNTINDSKISVVLNQDNCPIKSEETHQISIIQTAHDDWMRATMRATMSKCIADHDRHMQNIIQEKKDFLKLIDYQPPKQKEIVTDVVQESREEKVLEDA